MNKKDNRELTAQLMGLMEAVLDIESSPERVANEAIYFCKSILSKFPDVKENIDYLMENYDSSDPDFKQKWDRNISWNKFIKNL